MPEKTKDITTQEANEALIALRKTVDSVCGNHKTLEEKLAAMDGMDRETFEKANKLLDEQEKKNQEITAKQLALEKAEQEKKERIENLESQIVNMTSGKEKVDYKASKEYKSFNALATYGSFEAIPENVKGDIVRTDIGVQGGFRVPVVLASEVLKQIEEISPVRQVSRVRPIKTKTLEVVIRSSLPTAYFEGETEKVDPSRPGWKKETLTAHRQQTLIQLTRDQLAFDNFDVQQDISEDASTAFAQSEGKKCLLGTGVKEPQGILDPSAGVQTIDTAASGVVSMKDVIKLSGYLKQGYNPVYFFNRRVSADLRVEQDENGNFLWRIGAEGMPNDIAGDRYLIMQDMPNVAVGNKPIGYGDFMRGYHILDALEMELIRDDYTKKDSGIIEFSWHRYLTGRVVLSEAFKLLKIKA